jgi:putative transposase
MKLTIKLRLRDKHSSELCRQVRAINFVWNYCNEIQKKAVTSGRKWMSYEALTKLTAGSSKELVIAASSIQEVCRVYDKSRFQQKKSWLRWRSRYSLGWVPFNTEDVKFDGQRFSFRKISYETMHLHPSLQAGVKIGAGSFNCDSRGRWYINLTIDVAITNTATTNQVGLDFGLKNLLTLSNGQIIHAPKFYRKSEEKLAAAQRAKKSKRVKKIHTKIANRRKDFLHKESTKLVNSYGFIVLGDIKSSKLVKSNLAKSIYDAGWFSFKSMIEYKSHLRAGYTITVSERLTTQTCSVCYCIGGPKGIAGLGIREWSCSECGTIHDRDVNAAKNILRIGLDTLAEGIAKIKVAE